MSAEIAPRSSPKAHAIVLALMVLAAAVLEIYAQVRAFAWDEGFHLVTAQSILRGKRPYLDFCFPQTPLNAYWNAGWMRVFPETWRTPHAVAATMTALGVLLIAAYVLRNFPAAEWRVHAAVTAVCLFGLNLMVVEFGTIAQAYGLCLFLIVTAFLFAVSAVGKETMWFTAAAGLAASAAANCSLLAAPVAPVLLVWVVVCNRVGSRWLKAGAFVAGALVACAPLAWLFVQGPKQTIFNVFQYNLRYRQVQWAGAVEHNFDEWFAWVGSPQAWTLGLLAISGLLFVRKRSGWKRIERREFYLCAWLAVALLAHISTATPTFRRYYLLAVPFLAILACAGLYDIACRLGGSARPWGAVLLACLITAACLAKRLIESRNDFSWYHVEQIAAKVNQVTPMTAALLADEPVYFVTRHVPPSGLELADSHKLEFPPALAREFHVIPQKELDREVKSGMFDTVEISSDDTHIEQWGLHKMYAKSVEVVDEYTIFWDKHVAAK